MPAVTLPDLMRCSIGTTAFVLTGLSASAEPVVKEGKGRTGTKTTVKGEGYLEGTDAADYQGKLAAAFASLNTSGQDLMVMGLAGAVLWAMPAAQCLDGGPHVKFDFAEAGPLRTNVSFEANADQPSSEQDALDSFNVQIRAGPDGLRTVTWTGEMHRPNATTLFLGTALPRFQQNYGPPHWWVETQYQTGGTARASKLAYTLTAHELYGPLPQAGANRALQGRLSIRTERDEQQRKTQVWDLDLLAEGDAAALVSDFRSRLTGAGGQRIIFRESVTVETIEANHITASFTVLDSGSGTPLMDFRESVTAAEAIDLWEEKQYPGVPPVVVKKPQYIQRITQEGAATCAGLFIRPGRGLYEAGNLEPPQVTFEDVNDVEKRTTWRYVMFAYTQPNIVPVFTAFHGLFSPKSIDRPSLDQGPSSFYQPRKTPGT